MYLEDSIILEFQTLFNPAVNSVVSEWQSADVGDYDKTVCFGVLLNML